MNTNLKKTVGSGLFLALCMVLPFLTGQIPTLGSMLLPMHLPVLLCGMLYGPTWGGAVGFIAPLLRFVIFGRPMIFPTGIAMAFELMAYGIIAGLLISALPKKLPYTYISLVAAMLGGRIVWAVVRMALTLFGGGAFTFSIFLAEGFVNAIPGIILQLVLIPPLTHLLRRAVKE